MGEIGFVNLCHEDYIDKNVNVITDRAIQALTAQQINVYKVPIPASNYSLGLAAGLDLASRNLDGVILFLGSWMECSTALAVIREIEHLPMLLWGFPMFMDEGKLQSTGSYVSYAMFKGTMVRAGFRFVDALGLPEDKSIINEVISFCRAAITKTALKRIRIGLVGYTSMSIYPGTFDHLLLRTRIGPEAVHFDSYTVIKKAESLSGAERQEAARALEKSGIVHTAVCSESLHKAGGIFRALKDLCYEQDLDAINVKCQYEFSKEYKMVPCVPLSALADTGIVAACEGDMLCTVSMQILSLITGQTVAYGDVINSTHNIVKLSSCGMLPFSMGEGERTICNFMPHDGFHGIQASFVMRPEQVTAMRLIEDVGSYHMLYFTGEGQKTELRQGYMPALDIKLDGNLDKLIKHFSGQHFAICYGDYSSELEKLCTLLGIDAIRI